VKPLVGQITAFHAAASDPDGDAVKLAWDFGDAQLATGPDPAHGYATAGTKTVTATATDPQGVSTVRTLEVSVLASVTKPTCRVPKLKGLSLARAKAAIKKAGCKLGKVRKPRLKGGHKRVKLVVRSQSPKAGKKVPRGTKVSVKLGPKGRKKRH
jgi:PKD repeat protein